MQKITITGRVGPVSKEDGGCALIADLDQMEVTEPINLFSFVFKVGANFTTISSHNERTSWKTSSHHNRGTLIQCHFCKRQLHENNNAMTRCMSGQDPAHRGFGWVTVIVKPFSQVPCCDICMDTVHENEDFLMA